MAKYRRQPKAGELARKPSAPFAVRPREIAADNFAPALTLARPLSEHEATVIPAGFRIKTYAAAPRAANSMSWRTKGGMTGGASGSTRGVCSCNGSGVVPKAFVR